MQEQLLYWPHLCGEDVWIVLPWLTQLTEGQGRWLMGQVLKWRFRWSIGVGWRWVRKDYISWRTLHKKRGGKRRGKKKERTFVSSVSYLGNLYERRPPWIQIPASSDSKSTQLHDTYSHVIIFKIRISRCQIHLGLVFLPILYKFIVLGLLGQETVQFGLGSQNRDPTIGTVCGKNFALNKYNGRTWWDQVHTRQSQLVPNRKTTFLTLNGKRIRTNSERVVYKPPTQAEPIRGWGVTYPKGKMTTKPCNGKLTT